MATLMRQATFIPNTVHSKRPFFALGTRLNACWQLRQNYVTQRCESASIRKRGAASVGLEVALEGEDSLLRGKRDREGKLNGRYFAVCFD